MKPSFLSPVVNGLWYVCEMLGIVFVVCLVPVLGIASVVLSFIDHNRPVVKR
ncbi:MAG TPA: hypothetical protein VG796_20975 [Verrucomicrobiales bacterium]|jgi:hypothetical protein|nr:hypothetical protein [Verrucomicrobiales bacterium]